MTRFPFAFDPAYRLPALLFGVSPRTAWVEVGPSELFVRYGPWSLRSALENVRSAEVSGGFAYLKTVGPPHLSFTDRGVSFTTNARSAVCVEFDRPVAGLDPTGRLLKHPGATMSVADVDGLLAALSA